MKLCDIELGLATTLIISVSMYGLSLFIGMWLKSFALTVLNQRVLWLDEVNNRLFLQLQNTIQTLHFNGIQNRIKLKWLYDINFGWAIGIIWSLSNGMVWSKGGSEQEGISFYAPEIREYKFSIQPLFLVNKK